MILPSRREFLCSSAGAIAAAGLGLAGTDVAAQLLGERPKQTSAVKVLNPRMRVPLSLIIDDSTCLVNLNRFAIPQFTAAWNYERFDYAWRHMPVEIPDDFVRKFGEWCGEQGIKGKYSVVPYPACVGRLDRELPGWTSKQLKASIDLVRDLMMTNWDIHPEMVTHTRVIDTKTGHPIPKRGPDYMENWFWADGRSVEELTDYLSYGLQILKNIDLPCEGITTPGGFGGKVVPELSQATRHSVRNVFGAEIPHYFKFIIREGNESVAPRVEYAAGLGGNDPECVVSIIGCTGDWTGGWDCSSQGDLDRFITPDLKSGRMVEVIDRGEPALIVCHWTGIYFNGEEVGFKVFQEVVRRMQEKYDHLLWMKLSEIARYWAAKELTAIERDENTIALNAPFACPAFTFRVSSPGDTPPTLVTGSRAVRLTEVRTPLQLESGTWIRQQNGVTVCCDLPKGESRLGV